MEGVKELIAETGIQKHADRSKCRAGCKRDTAFDFLQVTLVQKDTEKHK